MDWLRFFTVAVALENWCQTSWRQFSTRSATQNVGVSHLRCCLLVFHISLLAASTGCCKTGTAQHFPSTWPHKTAVTEAAVGMQVPRTLSTGTLAYHVVLTRLHVLSIELGTRFELIVRERPDTAKRNTKARHIDLGTPDFDILDLVATDDGTRAFVASRAGWVRTYRLSNGELLAEWRMGSGATSLALSDDNRFLLIGTESGVICLRRLRDAAQLQCVVAHQGRVSSLDTRNNILASGSWSGEVALWSLPSLRLLAKNKEPGYVTDIAFAKARPALAVARSQRHPIRSPTLNTKEREDPRVDPVGNNTILLRNSSNLQITATLQGHRSLITSLTWVGPNLVSTSWDRTVRLWNAKTRQESHVLLTLAHQGTGGSASSQGLLLLSAWGIENDHPSLLWSQLLFSSL